MRRRCDPADGPPQGAAPTTRVLTVMCTTWPVVPRADIDRVLDRDANGAAPLAELRIDFDRRQCESLCPPGTHVGLSGRRIRLKPRLQWAVAGARVCVCHARMAGIGAVWCSTSARTGRRSRRRRAQGDGLGTACRAPTRNISYASGGMASTNDSSIRVTFEDGRETDRVVLNQRADGPPQGAAPTRDISCSGWATASACGSSIGVPFEDGRETERVVLDQRTDGPPQGAAPTMGV